MILDPQYVTLLTPRSGSLQPPVVLAHLARTQKSLAEHGENVRADWAPDGSKIVIQVRVPRSLLTWWLTGSGMQTAGSYLALVTVEYKSYLPVYQAPALSSASQRSFQPGPGEAHPVHSVSLHFEGVIFVEGHLLRSVSAFSVLEMGLNHLLVQVYLRDGITSSSRPETLVRCKEFHGLTQMGETLQILRGVMTPGVWMSLTSLGWIVPMVAYVRFTAISTALIMDLV